MSNAHWSIHARIAVALTALFALGIAPRESRAGNLIEDALSSLISKRNQLQDQINRARDEIGKLHEQRNTIEERLKSARGELRQLEKKTAGAVPQLDQARGRIADLERQARDVSGGIARVHQDLQMFAAERQRLGIGLEGARRTADQVLRERFAQNWVVFDVTTEGHFALNLRTGSVYSRIALSPSLTIDASRFERILQGEPALPTIDPIGLAMELSRGDVVNRKSGYSDARRGFETRYAGTATYVASRRFTEWASPEHLAAEAAKLAVTGGGSSGDSAAEARQQLQMEFEEIANWLDLQARTTGRRLAPEILESAFAAMVGARAEQQVPALRIEAMEIPQSYSLRFGVGTTLPPIIAQKVIFAAPSQTVQSRHYGFGLSLAGLSDRAATERAWRDFDSSLLQAPPDLEQDFDRLIGRFGQFARARDLVSGARYAESANRSAHRQLVSNLIRQLGLTQQELRDVAAWDRPVVDLANTPIGGRLNGMLRRFAIGNEGQGRAVRLSLDVSRMTLEADIVLQHKHRLGNLAELTNSVNAFAARVGPAAEGWRAASLQAVSDLPPELKNSLAAMEVRLRQLEGAIGQLGRQEQGLGGHYGQLQGALGQAHAIQDDILRRITPDHMKLGQLRDRARDLDNRVHDLGRALARSEGKLKDLGDDLKDVLAHIETLSNEWRNRFPDIPVDLSGLERGIRRLPEQVGDASRTGGAAWNSIVHGLSSSVPFGS